MLTDNDIAAFFADWAQLAHDDYVRFVYRFTPTTDPRKAAAALCAEQSTAMWRRCNVREDLRDRFGAKVICLEPTESDAQEWNLVIAHPHRNFGTKLPNLLVAACGEGGFYSPGIATIKLHDILFPDSYLAHFSGPQFGLAGVRESLHIFERPLFIGVVKPNLGLSPADFAALAGAAWRGGLDIAKDDEMQADAAWSPLIERVHVVAAARDAAQKETGERKAFIANITDELENLPTQCRAAVAAGADMVMINPIWTGISALRLLRNISERPIMAHFAGAAVLSRIPDFGMSSALLTKLMRIAGADLIGIAGFGERMRTTPEEVLANIAACLSPLAHIAKSLPIPGGSDSARTLPDVYAKIDHHDFGFIAGRGVFGHPDGPSAGAASVREVWARTAKISAQSTCR